MGNLIAKFAFFPPRDTYSEKDVSVWLQAEGGHRIAVYLVKYPRPRFCLLLSHGNAEDIGMNQTFCRWMSNELQVDVVTYDYVGYGLSSGQPSEADLYTSIDAVYKYLTQSLQFPLSHIILLGKSLGSAPSIDLASRHRVQGLILVSPLASGARVVMPASENPFLDSMFCNNIGKISNVKSAVFIMHGDEDEVVPFSNGQQLYNKCKHTHPVPPLWIAGAHHNDIESLFAQQFLGGMRMFLDHCWELRALSAGSVP